MKIRALLGVALLAWAGTAGADVISILLGTGNSAINGFPGPYASVDVNRTDSTHATITFTGLTQGTNQFRMGAQGAAAVNVNASAFSVSGLTGSSSPGTGYSGVNLSNAGAG